jgi:serine/threonine-protein kinase
MLMEFVDGVSLEQKLKDGVLPVQQAVDCIMQVLSALEYAHLHGVVHRDIKPANMMVTAGGVVKLMDFGIAKAASDQKLTMTGTTMGSLYYMSPEQIQGSTVDGRSDLYSVGVSLYELVTGKHPFDGDSQFAIMSAHLKETPVPPIHLDPRLPQALNDMIVMSVSRDITRRFQSAAAFRKALSSVAGPVTVPVAAAVAAPPPIAQKDTGGKTAGATEKGHGRRGLWIAVGALTTAAIVVGLIQFGPLKRSKAASGTTISAPVPKVVTQPADATSVAEQPATSAPSGDTSTTALPVTVEKQPAASAARPVKQNKVAEPFSQPASQTQKPQETAGQQSQPAVQPVIQPPAVQAQPPPSKPVNPGPSREEIQAAREQYMLLNSRASGIRASLQTLQRSQASSGLNLRGDMQEASTLMNSYLGEANSAMNEGDTASAKSFMEKAERQIEKLEKFLGR